MRTTAFHNTINAEQPQLDLFEDSNKKQDDQVLMIFETVPCDLAWSEVKELLTQNMHEGSIKRALSNLTKDFRNKITGEVIREKKLFRTKIMIMGPYGKQIHRYSLIKADDKKTEG